MGQRYIGAKTRILSIILNEVRRIAPPGATVADLMCGTGSVALELRLAGYRVVANDVMRQAYHITRAKLFLERAPPFEGVGPHLTTEGQRLLSGGGGYQRLLQQLNTLPPIEGYFWREFSPGGRPENGTVPRKYFSTDNARRIDACRTFVGRLARDHAVSEIEFSLLVHDLIMAANDCANIAGTYGHYLSRFVPRALQSFCVKPMEFERGGLARGHKVFNSRAEDIARSIKADICYLDPPYKKRQYAANYHILETIAKGDEPEAIGVSGLRDWWDEYSDFCSKVKFGPALERIIGEADCPRFLLSYSSEGLLSIDALTELLSKFGTVAVKQFPYKRFKSRNEVESENVTEYLFSLRKTGS